MSVVGPIAAKKLQGRECSEVLSLQQDSPVIRSSRPHRRTPAIRGTDVMECWRGLLRLDVGCPDDLAPFLGFIGHELTEIGWRECERDSVHVGEPRSEASSIIDEAGPRIKPQLL